MMAQMKSEVAKVGELTTRNRELEELCEFFKAELASKDKKISEMQNELTQVTTES